jgi:hypothetical protein
MKIKVNSSNDVKIGDVIGFTAENSGWFCAMVDHINGNRISGYFIELKSKEIDLEYLKRIALNKSEPYIAVTINQDYQQKYVIRL